MAPGSTFKLTYFNVTALGEPIRMLLSHLKIDFEDFRFESEQWPAIKPTTPYGQVPMLEIDGKKYVQSMAICRFLAKKSKVLVGNDEWEDLAIDAVVDLVNDFRMKIGPAFYETDEAIKAKKYKEIDAEIIPFYGKLLDGIAKENDGHLACKRLTWADFVLAGEIKYINGLARGDLLEKYKDLKRAVDNVWNLPEVKAYLAKRPETTM